MEFWGVEVKSGGSIKVEPGVTRVVHISLAALGEAKKDQGNEPVYLYLKVDGHKFVLGTLSHDKIPQSNVDVVLEKDFELSHSWKNGSVYFSGYKVETDEQNDSSEDDTEDDLPVRANNGKTESKTKPDVEKAAAAKPVSAAKQVNFTEPKKEDDESDSDDDDDDSDKDDDTSSSAWSSEDQGPILNGKKESNDSSSDDDDDSEDDSEDEETPKKLLKPESSKKRPAESPLKTPVADKKAKVASPQNKEVKKTSGHVATPYPKQFGKKLASNEQAKQQTPKSAGSHPCKSCNRSFTSEVGLQSHTKAKHA